MFETMILMRMIKNKDNYSKKSKIRKNKKTKTMNHIITMKRIVVILIVVTMRKRI